MQSAGTGGEILNFRNNHCFGFTDRFAGSTPQTVLRPIRVSLDREIKHIHRTVDDALLAPVTLLGVDIHKIDFIINVLFSHKSGPVCFGPIELRSTGPLSVIRYPFTVVIRADSA
jgi:hypothetical protein